jgi:uncharacterized protein with GYD domain
MGRWCAEPEHPALRAAAGARWLSAKHLAFKTDQTARDGSPARGGTVIFPDQRRCTMSTYIILVDWTDQGMRQVKDSPKRIDQAKNALREMGGQFKAWYMTMGGHDLVAIYEAPDDAVAARFTLMLGMLGNVRTKTLKAFPEDAYRAIVNSLG